jgi:hypothetical protein
MLWERIQMLRRHGDKETAQVREALEVGVLARRGIDDCRLPIDDCSEDETRPADADWSSESPAPSGESPVSGSEQSSIDNRQSAIPESSIDNRQSAIRLLGALAVCSCLGAVLEADKDLKAAYYRLLVTLYGALPDFDFFKPKKPTLDDRMADLSSFVFQSLAMKDGPLQRQKQSEIQWPSGFGGREPGGGPRGGP